MYTFRHLSKKIRFKHSFPNVFLRMFSSTFSRSNQAQLISSLFVTIRIVTPRNANALIGRNYHEDERRRCFHWRGRQARISRAPQDIIVYFFARWRRRVPITVCEHYLLRVIRYVYVTHYRHGTILSSLWSRIRAQSITVTVAVTFDCARKAILPENALCWRYLFRNPREFLLFFFFFKSTYRY